MNTNLDPFIANAEVQISKARAEIDDLEAVALGIAKAIARKQMEIRLLQASVEHQREANRANAN